MKIVDVKPLVLRNDPPYIGGRYLLWVEVITDEGISGWGERVTGSGSTGDLRDLESHISLLQEYGRRFLIGENPFNIEDLWQRIYASRHDFRHPSLHATPALSALEMALWDIVGKACNQPIYNLLGGRCWDKLRAYAYMPQPDGGFMANPEAAGPIAEKLLRDGNTACKIDPFMPLYPIPRDIGLKEIEQAGKIWQSIRDAVGNDLEVGIGTHGQLTTYSAIRVADYFEQWHPFWFEEPVPPENIDEMARVAAHTSIPIATGERLVTKYEFSQLLEKQAAQIVQLDVGQCGGILESKKIAGIAEAHYAVIAPHMYCGPIAAAAAVQLDTCSPNFMIAEANQGPLHQRIFEDPLVFEDGFIIPPTGPGLGVVPLEEVIAAQRVE